MSKIDEDAFGSMAGALSKYGKGVGADPKKPRRASLGGQTMTGHTEKKVGSGTVYQKKLTHYGDHQEKPVVEKPEGEVKRGRGRPPGKHGSYKARTGDAAATAAKAAATKAANKAARNESMTEDDFSDICEMHELESFDDLLEFALELDEMQIDELSKATLGSYIKKASAKAQGLATTAMQHHVTATKHARDSWDADQKGHELSARRSEKKAAEYDQHSYDATEKQKKTAKGIDKAVGRLTKEDVQSLIDYCLELDEGDRMEVLSALSEVAYDSDALKDPKKPVIARGVKGMKSTPFEKKFKSMEHYDKWADSDASGDHEVHDVRLHEAEELSEAMSAYVDGMKRLLPDF